VGVWGVLLVPAALAAVALLLASMAWLERWVLSPQSIIRSAGRARRAPADHVENLVAEQCEVLLGPTGKPPVTASVRPTL
jgi:hypothetical protein